MPPSNVDLARSAVEAFNRRDRDAFVALMDERVEVESRLMAVQGGYHGHVGARRWWDDFLSMIPDYVIEAEEIRDLGDFALVRLRGEGHGAASDAPVLEAPWMPIQFIDGRCVWWRVCLSEDEAHAAIAGRRAATARS